VVITAGDGVVGGDDEVVRQQTIGLVQASECLRAQVVLQHGDVGFSHSSIAHGCTLLLSAMHKPPRHAEMRAQGWLLLTGSCFLAVSALVEKNGSYVYRF
jgi:hypothetical protein